MQLHRLLTLGALILPFALVPLAGCDDPDPSDTGSAEETGSGDGDGEAEAETEAGDGDGDPGDGDGDPGPVDSDEDGLTDEEEAELGTDPNLKDTDADNYWDSWEVIEMTDPLDASSRIYTGYWPYNPNKDELDQGSWDTASTVVGSPFPRHSFLDHHGDYVDLYDFSNFVLSEQSGGTGELSYFIFDLSAQWCGPCHNVAEWMSGVDDQNTSWIQTAYPTVRDKVHSLRIWWITFIVENSSGGAPTLADATTWEGIHQDPYIPIMVDETQQVRDRFLGPAYPHFFLLDFEMKIEYFPPANAGSDTDPYPAVGLVDQHL
jgi:hypothetical protein